jgi:prepilin-type N-terminal cleavage/methylation domain-containing protein
MNKRKGFTLMEMLVATALTLFLMAVISECFVTGLETFRQLKAVGDMQEGLRVAVNNLRADLQLAHFERARRLSDPDLVSNPVQQGFFVIFQGQMPGVPLNGAAGPNSGATWIQEGKSLTPGAADSDTMRSYQSFTNILHFTVRPLPLTAPGNTLGPRRENMFTAAGLPLTPANAPFVPSPLLPYNRGQGPPYSANPALQSLNIQANFIDTLSGQPPDSLYFDIPSLGATTATYNSQWAEVAYFLLPQANGATANGTPLFTLWRAQFVIVPSNGSTAAPGAATINTNVYQAGGKNFPLPASLFGSYQTIACNIYTDPGTVGPDPISGNNANNQWIYFYNPNDLRNLILAGPPSQTVPLTNVPAGFAPSTTPPTNNATLGPYGFQPPAQPPFLLPRRTFNPANPSTRAAAPLVSNVVSFTVRLLTAGVSSDTLDVAEAFGQAISGGTTGAPPGQYYKNPPPFMYDSSTITSSVRFPQIYGLEITIRVWDATTQQSRQITILQDM